jgi:O-acetyl-ADP-ribose deacetylase (regulator of RNase III)
MIKYVDGDLIKLALKGEFDVIVHGCNCFCQMGAGIAPQMDSGEKATLRSCVRDTTFHYTTV